MSKVMYKTMDRWGRITLPPRCRKFLELNEGDIVRIEQDDKLPFIKITKLDIVDVNEEEPEKIEALINAAIKMLSSDKKVELATYLLGSRQKHQKGGKKK